MLPTDENPYRAPQAARKRPFGQVPADNTGAKVAGALIGALVVPVWSLVDLMHSGIWISDGTDFVLMTAWFALLGGCIGNFIASIVRSR
jgi:hypothetical protein